jgi:hypothetical protein
MAAVLYKLYSFGGAQLVFSRAMNPIKRARTQDVEKCTPKPLNAAAPEVSDAPLSGVDYGADSGADSGTDDAADAAIADKLEQGSSPKVAGECLRDASPVPDPQRAAAAPAEADECVAPPAGAAGPGADQAVLPVIAASPDLFELVPGAPNGLVDDASDSDTDSDHGEQVCPASPSLPDVVTSGRKYPLIGILGDLFPAVEDARDAGPAAAFGEMLEGRKEKMLAAGEVAQTSCKQLMEAVSEPESSQDVRTDVSGF